MEMIILADFATTIRKLRVERGITQEQLAAMLKVSRSTIGMYETGSREPDFETCEAIADIFNVDMDYLLGRTSVERKAQVFQPDIPPGFQPMPEMSSVPRVGRIACGTPILAEENIEALDSIPAKWRADFTLLCEGDSMEPKIKDGDLVAIRTQEAVENGEIAAVRIDCEATLKCVFVFPDHIELRAENPSFPTIIRIGEDMNDVHIEGKAVGLCRGL